MPYIEQKKRQEVDRFLKHLELECIELDPGTLNYIICKIIDKYYNEGQSYQRICEIMGTLSCVSQEWYSRIASGYEAKKRLENGEVFETFTPKKHYEI